MEEFIYDITKLFMIKTCCCNEKTKENCIIVEAKDNKWKNYRGFSGLHSDEIKKIYHDLEDKMDFKKDNRPKTPRRVPQV
jgi:tagatose-1,6-bisphosphate aldolase non-catalytic subunit AgaZ/GatZ